MTWNLKLIPLLTTSVLFVNWAALLGVDDHRVVLKIDKKITIAPAGTPKRGMMSMVRDPKGTIYLNFQAEPPKLYKSSDIVLRSHDGGETWGDPTRVYPQLNPHESALAIDPHDSNHLLLMTRIQTSEKWYTEAQQEELMRETGNPRPHYKNGALFKSTDGGRTFGLAKGGMTDWYGHRGTIYWSRSDVVVVTHGAGGRDSRKVARLSLDAARPGLTTRSQVRHS